MDEEERVIDNLSEWPLDELIQHAVLVSRTLLMRVVHDALAEGSKWAMGKLDDDADK